MATEVSLPTDTFGRPIGALTSTGARATVSTTDTATGNTLPSGTVGGDVIRVATTTDVYLSIGTGAQTADTTDMLVPAGVEYMVVPQSATHYSAIRVTDNGRFQIEKMR